MISRIVVTDRMRFRWLRGDGHGSAVHERIGNEQRWDPYSHDDLPRAPFSEPFTVCILELEIWPTFPVGKG